MLEKLLLPVDGSDHSKKAASLVAEIAKHENSQVLVLHVHEQEFVGRGTYAIEAPAEAKALVDGVVADLKAKGINASGDLRHGHIAGEILAVAKEWDAGLIVMGSRGRSDLEGLLVGSTTHKVVHLGHCPVLVIR